MKLTNCLFVIHHFYINIFCILVNFEEYDDIVEIIGNRQLNESTETLSYKSFPSIYNEFYSVIKKNNELSTFVVGMILEMKYIIMSKQNKSLYLNRMITHFSNFKNMFTRLEKGIQLMLIEPSSSSLKDNTKRRKVFMRLIKIKNPEIGSY